MTTAQLAAERAERAERVAARIKFLPGHQAIPCSPRRHTKGRNPRISALLALACAGALASAAGGQTVDAQALQAIAATNERTAHALELGTCAAERTAVANTAAKCADTVCIISVAAIAALTPCAAARAQGIVQAQAPPPPTIINAAPPPTVAERVVGLFAGTVGKLFDFAIANGPSYLNYRLGTVQSNNQTALGIVNSNNALGAQQSTNGTFAAFGGNIASTASAGLSAVQGTAAAGFRTNSTISGQGFGAATALGNNIQGVATSGFAANTALGNNIQGVATAGFASNTAIAGAGTAALRDTAGAAFGVMRDLGLKPSTNVTGSGNNLITGTGNTTQSGTDNRQGSPGPCTGGNGGNQTGTATPSTVVVVVNKDGTTTTTTTAPTTTGVAGAGGASPCKQ